MESGRVYFLTLSTYGSHLLGDPRGSCRWNGDNVAPNRPLHKYMTRNLKEPIVEFSSKERAFLHDRFLERARQSEWVVDALNVRTRHVHIVLFTPRGEPKSDVMRKLKESGTRALYRKGFRQKGTPVWTKMNVCASVWNVVFWRRAVDYTLYKQGANAYLRESEFGQNWIGIIRATPSEKKRELRDLYGGDEREAERGAFFQRVAESRGT